MRMRGLLIAVALLAALAGGVYWSNKSKEAAEKKNLTAEPATTPKILAVPEGQFAKLSIRKTGGEATVAELKAGKWELTSPKPLGADPESMRSMTTALSSLNADRVIEEKAANLGEYGLEKPSIEVTVTQKDGKTRRLLIGDEVPTGTAFYARVDGDPRVFTIPSYTKTSLDKDTKDLRDKRLLTFDSDKLTRVELTAKGQSLELGKNNQNDWQILKPKPMRADGGQVEELVRKLRDAKMDSTAMSDEDAKKAAAAFAAGTPVAVAKVTDAAGTQELQIRKDKDKSYYAKSSVVQGVYKTTSDVGGGLDKGIDDLRNKKVFDFGWSDPTKMDVRDGAKQASYQKSGDKWMSGGKQMDSTTMQTLVDKLRDLSATKFPDKGFSTAAIDLTVTANDGKRVERVALAKTGNDWFAKRENEPALYQVDSTAVDELQKAIGAVKEAAPPAKKK